MNARLLAAGRLLKRVVSVLVTLVLLVVVAAALAAYLGTTGKSLPILRAITTRVGQLVAGQRTEQLTLDVRLLPSEGRLAGTAVLTMRSVEDGRRRFYFLLNDGLRVRNVHVTGVDTTLHAPSAYQFWLLTVVDVGAAVAKGATIQLTFEYDGAPGTSLPGIASNFLNAEQVLLNVDTFWYPSDVQSFFSVDVTVTLPNRMTLVHNGTELSHAQRGELQQVRWVSQRPVAGLSLVAGAYELTTTEADGVTYRVYRPAGIQLDATRLIKMMSAAAGGLTERYGPSGFKQITMFISRDFRRAFNDGSGLIGVSLRYVRTGDYGFAVIAHEIAHDWWGATVGEKWLSPGTGGEWIVEGFAEFSSLVAAETQYGTDALTRRLAGEFFDPARQSAIAEMSVLDNVLNEATARDTIYKKGAYVAMMLRRTLGDEVYFKALRQFIERFRYQQVTDHDLQQLLETVSGQSLEPYFSDWVRSNRLADLALDSTNPSELIVRNFGTAMIPTEIDLWTYRKGGGEPVRSKVNVGDHVALDPDVDHAVLDPQLTWADVQRENNQYPQRLDPVYVAASPRGEVAVTRGDVFPWARASVSRLTPSESGQHSVEFTRGLVEPPAWLADGVGVLVNYSDDVTMPPAVISLTPGGLQHTLGRGNAPASAPEGVTYAAKEDRIVRWRADGSESTVIQRRGESLERPLPAPDGARIAYIATRGNHLELRLIDASGEGDRALLAWDRDRMVYRWSNDGARLYAIIGGSWDWQIWEIPVGAEPVRVLVSAAAAITDLAVSPDGTQLAFTACPELDYPTNRRQLFVMNLADQKVRTIDVADADLSAIAWTGESSLLVVATAAATDQPWVLPTRRTLKRLRLSDGAIEDVK